MYKNLYTPSMNDFFLFIGLQKDSASFWGCVVMSEE